MKPEMSKRNLRYARSIAKKANNFGIVPAAEVQRLVNSGLVKTKFIEDTPVERVWILAGLNPVSIRLNGVQ